MTENPHDKDVSFIRALAELLRENDLTDLRVRREYGEDDSLDVRVSRMAPQQIVSHATPTTHSAPAPASDHPRQSSPSELPDDPAGHPGAITSPMVGTAYMSPEPGASAFVRVGDDVEEGQTLLIVEAMKTMNQIPSPRPGRIARILVEDGAPVEFGAPLMILE